MIRRLLDLAGGLAVLAALAIALLMLVPALLGYQRYVVTTGSMAGTYDPGTLIVDRQVPVADLRVGDVITYRPPADARVPGLITHRIHSIGRDATGRTSFRTKGDANGAADPFTFVPGDPTMNQVALGVPYVGFVFSFLNSGTGRVLVFMVPGVLIGLGAVRRLWREAGAATATQPEAAA